MKGRSKYNEWLLDTIRGPPHIDSSQWYMLLAIFMAIWMLMFMRYWNV